MSTASPLHRFGSRVLTTLQRAFTVFGVAVALFLVLSPRPLTDASGVPVAVASMLFALATMVRVDGGRATAHATEAQDEDDRPDPAEVGTPPTAVLEPTAPDVDPSTADAPAPEPVATAVGAAPSNTEVEAPDRPPPATVPPAPDLGVAAPAADPSAPIPGDPAAPAAPGTWVGAGDDTARYDLVVRTDSGAALALRVGGAAPPSAGDPAGHAEPAGHVPTDGTEGPVTVAPLPVERVGAILGAVTDPLGRSSALPILVSISLRTEPARAAVSLVDLVRRSGFDPADLVVEVVDGDAADPALHRALAALDGAGMALTWRIDGFDLVDLAQLDGLPITYVSFDLDPLARLGASGTGGAAVATRFAHDLGFDSLARTVPGRVTLVELAGIGFRAAADPSWPDPVPLGEVGGRLRERGVIPARPPNR